MSSIAAALRRVYIIPVKAGPFEKLHGRLPKNHPSTNLLLQHDNKFEKESNKLERMFNLILAFALYQQDVKGMYLEPRLHAYITKMVNDFSTTVFGTFYLSQKAKVDEVIQDVESLMMDQDCDDSSYLVKISTCVGQFQQLLN
jgi:hypothetical protein